MRQITMAIEGDELLTAARERAEKTAREEGLKGYTATDAQLIKTAHQVNVTLVKDAENVKAADPLPQGDGEPETEAVEDPDAGSSSSEAEEDSTEDPSSGRRGRRRAG